MNSFFSNLLAIESKDPKDLGATLENFLGIWWGPLIGAVAAAAGIIALVVGIKYVLAAQSGDEQKLKQAKTAAIGVIIGVVLTFLLVVIIPVLIGVLQTWQDNETAFVMLSGYFNS